MNVHEQSLALAMAWLDSVDDDVFLSEYNAIAEYAYVGPTVDEFLSYSSDCYLAQFDAISFESHIEFANYIDIEFAGNMMSDSVIFTYGHLSVNISSEFDRVCGGDVASNDESYSLAA